MTKLYELMAAIILVGVLTAAAGYKGYKLGYSAADDAYNKAVIVAKDAASKAQKAADDVTIKDLQNQLAQNVRADALHVQAEQKLVTDNATLQAKLKAASSASAVNAWLNETIPLPVVESGCWDEGC